MVGRTTSGSSSLASGSGCSLPSMVFEPVMGDDRHLLGEAFEMLGFLGDEGERDEQVGM